MPSNRNLRRLSRSDDACATVGRQATQLRLNAMPRRRVPTALVERKDYSMPIARLPAERFSTNEFLVSNCGPTHTDSLTCLQPQSLTKNPSALSGAPDKAHARRKFHDLFVARKNEVNTEALRRIGE